MVLGWGLGGGVVGGRAVYLVFWIWKRVEPWGFKRGQALGEAGVRLRSRLREGDPSVHAGPAHRPRRRVDCPRASEGPNYKYSSKSYSTLHLKII